MNAAAIIAGILLIGIILLDAFETIILPRGLSRRFRLASTFYSVSWRLWSGAARSWKNDNLREAILSYFGPLSLILLLVIWGFCLILGFALVQLGAEGVRPSLGTDLYMSGTTFFTLGLGDITPHTSVARLITVIEAGIGFGFLAIVIGYLPILYQAFSRREQAISLLDARGGSPPTASELLIRHGVADGGAALNQLLRDWEQWSAELLENHISYPVLCYYRSQHDRQSWLAAMSAILDTSALVIVGIDGVPEWQARLTFAMARHAVVDLAAIFGCLPDSAKTVRLDHDSLEQLYTKLDDAGMKLKTGPEAEAKLAKLRALYEPHVNSLAERMAFKIPPFVQSEPVRDAWKTTGWHDTDDS
jgi:hypothetical protein